MIKSNVVDISKFRVFLRNHIYTDYTLEQFKKIIEEAFTDEIKSITIEDNKIIVMELNKYNYNSAGYYMAICQCLYNLLTSKEISHDINIRIHSVSLNNTEFKALKDVYNNIIQGDCVPLLTNIIFSDSNIIIEL